MLEKSLRQELFLAVKNVEFVQKWILTCMEMTLMQFWMWNLGKSVLIIASREVTVLSGPGLAMTSQRTQTFFINATSKMEIPEESQPKVSYLEAQIVESGLQ